MASTDFALAQQRIEARRRLRDAQNQARQAQQSGSPIRNRLPYPLAELERIGARSWLTLRGREGTRPAFRVGQVDAELLDEELLDLLKAQVADALQYLNVRPPLLKSLIITPAELIAASLPG